MDVRFHRYFHKRFRKLLPAQQEKFATRLELFLTSEFHPQLRNHTLHGKYAGCRSIDIGGDLRAIYEHEGESSVTFLMIGTHRELYE